MTSLFLLSVVSLSLVISTIVLFFTVNESASVDIEDEDEESSMLIKRMAAIFTLNYLVRTIYQVLLVYCLGSWVKTFGGMLT